MSDILNNIVLDDLDGEQRQIADAIGIEAYRKLVKEFGGMHIYISGQEGFKAAVRNEMIRQDFDGYNFRELARKYELTESSIRYIVGDLKDVIRKKPIDGQESFF